MLAGIDESRQRHDLSAGPVRIGNTVTVGMGAGKRQKIILAEHAAGLLGDAADDVGERDAFLQRVGQHMASRIGRRLKADAGDPASLQPEFYDGADVVIVHAGVQRRHQNHANAMLAERFDGPQLRLDQRFSAQCLAALVAEPVELQVDLEAMAKARHVFEERRVVGETQPVGVDHDEVDVA